MLRRNAFDPAALRKIELALEAARPPLLADDRREALRLRIMSHLGPQAAPPPGLPDLLRQRWVAIPAAVGIAGLMLVAAQLVDGGAGQPADAYVAHADGNVEVNGQPGTAAVAGDVILARTTSLLTIGPDVKVGMEPGAALRYGQAGNLVSVAVQSGDVTVASASREVAVSQPEWQAAVRPSSVATFSLSALGTTVNVASGEVELNAAGQTYSVTAGNSPMRIPPGAAAGASGTSTATPSRSPSPGPSPSLSPSPSPSSTSQPPVIVPSPSGTAPGTSATPSGTPSASPSPESSVSPSATSSRTPPGSPSPSPVVDPLASRQGPPPSAESPGTP